MEHVDFKPISQQRSASFGNSGSRNDNSRENPPLDYSSRTGSSMWDITPDEDNVILDTTSTDEDTSSSATRAGDDLISQSPLLQRYPGFVPLRRHATSIAEVAFLVPSMACTSRQATMMVAVANMTATIVGGGVLSIPLSCARAGIVPFTFLMIVSAAATDFSLYLLVSCSRRCGSTSFGNVTRCAHGLVFHFISNSAHFLFRSQVCIWPRPRVVHNFCNFVSVGVQRGWVDETEPGHLESDHNEHNEGHRIFLGR